MDVRRKSVAILKEILKDDAYSNVALTRNLTMATPQERRTVTQLVYGVLEHKFLLEHIIKEYADMRLSKIKADVRIVLFLSLYQLLYMDSMPDRAVVDEGVKLANDVHSRYKKFVNGLLRNFIRNDKKYSLPTKALERASIESSCPIWLLELWTESYGQDLAISMAKNSVNPPLLTFRTNTLKTDRQSLMDALSKEGYQCKAHTRVDEAIIIEKVGHVQIGETKAYMDGWFTVQDSSSMEVAHFLSLEEGMKVLDMCAAPGGKTTHIGQLLNNTGHVDARDLFDHKCEKIEEHCQRLGIENVAVKVFDAVVTDETAIDQFDRVLVDAPCSGLGIIRRKPEIKYKKSLSDVKALVEIQGSILNNAAKYVKKGGYLVYSTCTLNPLENEKQVEGFLSRHSEFDYKHNDSEQRYHYTMISDDGDDGFFVCVLVKRD